MNGQRSYVAFVIRDSRSKQPIVRVNLGSAKPIDELITRWRQQLLPIDDARGPTPGGLGRSKRIAGKPTASPVD